MNASFGTWASSGSFATEEEDRAEIQRTLVAAPLAFSRDPLTTPSWIAVKKTRFDNASSRSGLAPGVQEQRDMVEEQNYVEEKVQEALDNLPMDATPEEQGQAQQEAISTALSSLSTPPSKNYLVWGLGGLLLIGVGFLIFKGKE